MTEPRKYATPGAASSGGTSRGETLAGEVEALRSTLDELTVTHSCAVHEVTTWTDHDPLLMRDEHGRFILLDGLTAIVNARAALTLAMLALNTQPQAWGGRGQDGS